MSIYDVAEIENYSLNELIWDTVDLYYNNNFIIRDNNGRIIGGKIIEPDYSYELNYILECEKEIERLQKLSDSEIEAEQLKECEGRREHYLKRIKEAEDEYIKYSAMLIKVKEWIPPSEAHNSLKNKMISDLEREINSISDLGYEHGMIDAIKLIPVKEWRDESISYFERKLKRTMNDLNKHKKTDIENLNWLIELLHVAPIEIK